MSFSFVIPSYNSDKTIARTISSILGQRQSELVKEIVVVDSSDDGLTREVIRAFAQPLINVVLLDKKTSPADGRNIGARMATGDVVCFIDSDVELTSTWLAMVTQAMEGGVKIGGGAIGLPGEQGRSLIAFAQLYLQFNEWLSSGRVRKATLLPACNMFCDRELFLKIGGFPSLRASEDTLFCLNARRLADIWFVPEARCAHIFREHWRSFLRNQALLGQFVMIYRRQYYGKWFYKGLWPVVMFPAFLAIKMGRIVIRLVKAGPGHFLKFLLSAPVFIIGLGAWAWGFIKESFNAEAFIDWS